MKKAGAEALRRALPEAALPLLDAVVREADRRRASVWLVGGPVRDWLLGVAVRDVDLLVVGDDLAAAGDLAERAAPDGVRVVRHPRFGTAELHHQGVVIELATSRRETYAQAGALPSVSPGTLDDDLARRDFGANALAFPLSKTARANDDRVAEADGALRDLEARRLRVQHSGSFRDDPTRALRAARLAQRLGLSVTRSTHAALRDALRAGVFGVVSGERLRREFVKLIDDAAIGGDPSRALRLLDDWHVLGALEPGLCLDRSAVVPLRRLGRAIATPPWKSLRHRPWRAALLLWLAPLPSGLRKRVLERLAVRGEVARSITVAIRQRDARLGALARVRGRGAVDSLLGPLDEEELHALYAVGEPKLRRRILRFATEDRTRRTPASGRDLVEIGLSGPVVGRALEGIREAFLDGGLSSRDEALVLAREIGRRSRTAKPGRRVVGRKRQG